LARFRVAAVPQTTHLTVSSSGLEHV